MAKANIKIKNQKDNEAKPVTLLCEDFATAQMKFEFLKTETFEEAVELELRDESNSIVETHVVKPN